MARNLYQRDDSEAVAFLQQLSEQQTTLVPHRPRSNHRRNNFFALNGIDNQGLSSRGGFRAGQFDRLMQDFNPGAVGPNAAHSGVAAMRQRARELVLNNPMAVSAVDAYISNVVETGIPPKPGFKDRETRQLWISAFNRWAGATAHETREADITEQETFYELQALWLREVIIGGGCLVHYVELPRKGRSIPLSLELLPEERFFDNIEWSGRNAKTANPIVNGVELDPSTGRPIAYWIKKQDSDFGPNVADESPIRISRDQAQYGFQRLRIGQQRGHSWLHSCIVWLWALGYYTDNEMIASNAKSSYAYMIKTDKDADFDWNTIQYGECESGTTDFYGNPIQRHEAGMVFRGAPGDDIAAVGPNVPGSDSSAWIEMIQRSIAIGSGLSYEEVCRDYSKGSFSSVRGAANADRRRFRRVWKFMDSHFNNPSYSRFASSGVRAGLDGFPSASEFVNNPDPWLMVKWEGPTWDSVNPSDDAKADDIKIKNGTKLRADCISGDIEDHFDAMEQEQITMQEKSLRFVSDAPVMAIEADAGSTDAQLQQIDNTKKGSQ